MDSTADGNLLSDSNGYNPFCTHLKTDLNN